MKDKVWEPICLVCGKTDKKTTKHIKYGPDVDNPVKHYFHPEAYEGQYKREVKKLK